MEFVGLLALGMAVFASTNVDDILILMLLFSDHQFTPRQVVMGQFTGILLLIGLSLMGSLAALFFPVKLLALFPIFIGLKKLADLWTHTVNTPTVPGHYRAAGSKTLAVAALTFANGGDNLGIYTPLFATSTPLQITFLTLIFLLMTAVWCLVGYTLIQRSGHQVQRAGRVVLPFVLIGLGVWMIGAS